jgi:NTP pyrophosphatase (non-canonical NTP hydrolase)
MRTHSPMSNLPSTERELEDCLAVVACVIDHHGEDYWPVYKLFEEELERLRSRRRRLNKTLSHIPSFQKARAPHDVH